MKIAVLLVAILIAASPVYAKKPNAKPAAPAVKCVTLDAVEKTLAPGVKVERKLVGDDLKKFNESVKAKGGNPPDNDGLLLLSKPDSDKWMAISAENGCVEQIFPVNPESFKKMLEGAKGEQI